MQIINKHGVVNMWPDGWDIPPGCRKATAKEIGKEAERSAKQQAVIAARTKKAPDAKSP